MSVSEANEENTRKQRKKRTVLYNTFLLCVPGSFLAFDGWICAIKAPDILQP